MDQENEYDKPDYHHEPIDICPTTKKACLKDCDQKCELTLEKEEPTDEIRPSSNTRCINDAPLSADFDRFVRSVEQLVSNQTTMLQTLGQFALEQNKTIHAQEIAIKVLEIRLAALEAYTR